MTELESRRVLYAVRASLLLSVEVRMQWEIWKIPSCEPLQPASCLSMRIFAMLIGVGKADWCGWVSLQGYPFPRKVTGARGHVVEMRRQCVEGKSNKPSCSDLQLFLWFAFALVNWEKWDRPLPVRKAKLTMTLRSGRNIAMFSL